MATAKQISTWKLNGILPDEFYDIPEPEEDAMRQVPINTYIRHLLMRFYEDDPTVIVAGEDFVFYDRTDGYRRVSPDIYIVFGVDAERLMRELPNYWAWEVGKVPDFALEVASPSTASNDLGWKRDLYARLGVTEYWRLDRTGGELYGEPLVGERLVDGEYQRYEIRYGADGVVEVHSELLGLDFRWDGLAFDVIDPRTGKTIDAAITEREARLEAEVRAESAEARAESAEVRAESAEARERELLEEIAHLRGKLDRN